MTPSTMLPDGPLVFAPLYFERPWGGRLLDSTLGREIPAGRNIGESWEIVDRPEAQSVVKEGALAGTSLHDLWCGYRREIFGADAPDAPRFPLLGKILDAREVLSVQVHPPAHAAARLGGEPKTEMWYLLEAAPGALIYAGLRRGVRAEDFARGVREGTVETLLHRLPVAAGDAMFVPSGRCHAIGAGCLIVEIQQNSDTTYRAYDWNRVDAKGNPRQLHIPESMASIDFDDYEPSLSRPGQDGRLIECEHFCSRLVRPGQAHIEPDGVFMIFIVTAGSVKAGSRVFRRGDWFVLPSCATQRGVTGLTVDAAVLRCTFPKAA